MNSLQTCNLCLDYIRELKKLWNMKLTEMSFVLGALETVSNTPNKRLGELNSADKSRPFRPQHNKNQFEYLVESRVTCFHSDYRERPRDNTDIKH